MLTPAWSGYVERYVVAVVIVAADYIDDDRDGNGHNKVNDSWNLDYGNVW